LARFAILALQRHITTLRNCDQLGSTLILFLALQIDTCATHRTSHWWENKFCPTARTPLVSSVAGVSKPWYKCHYHFDSYWFWMNLSPGFGYWGSWQACCPQSCWAAPFRTKSHQSKPNGYPLMETPDKAEKAVNTEQCWKMGYTK